MPTERTSRQTLDTYIIRRGDDTTPVNPVGWRDAMAALDAIEAEAREDEFDKGWSKGKAWGEKQERARIRVAVEGLPANAFLMDGDRWIDRAAVLRIIDREDTNDRP